MCDKSKYSMEGGSIHISRESRGVRKNSSAIVMSKDKRFKLLIDSVLKPVWSVQVAAGRHGGGISACIGENGYETHGRGLRENIRDQDKPDDT